MKKKKLLDKPENQRALSIALIVALILVAAEMLGNAIEWVLQIVGSSPSWAKVMSYIVIIFVILAFLKKCDK